MTNRTCVYIDGFNLYYGAVKGTPFKWLNLARMCNLLLPTNQILKIKYFTARVNARPNDPDQPIRQQTYLRALGTLQDLEIIYGHFLTNDCYMPLVGCTPGQQKYTKVIKTEEKGSDVYMAIHLLNDGYKRRYDLAVLITNDSDLLEAVRIVRSELGLAVGILNPHQHPSRVLQQQATFTKRSRQGVLRASQFPQTLQDARGTFSKPASW